MQIVFVLVEPARQENIGAAARALRTMGFGDLWLVGGTIERRAREVAHQSGDVLDRARHFPDLAAALAKVDFSIATGARRRLERDDYLTPEDCRTALAGKRAAVRRAALVFGRESSGLTGAELALCDAASRIPLAVEQPSLNLAQAVMVYAWTLRGLGTAAAGATAIAATDTETGTPAAPTFHRARQALDEALDRLGIGTDDNLRRRARELLARCDDRDLGMLMLLAGRLRQRL